MKLSKDLREFVELLNSAGVEYVIVGAHAVAYHGYPRYTGDIDFFVRPTAESGRKIVDVLSAFGFEETGLTAEDFEKPDQIIQLGLPPQRIDLLTGITAVSFDDAINGSEAGVLDGIPVRFLGRSELLRNKKATGRTKDAADVEELEE